MSIATMNATVPIAVNRIIGERGLKQGAVAERAGMSNQMLSDMLNGRRLIKARDVLALAKALDVTPNDLFYRDTEPQTNQSA